jgi:hypothetical protein
LLPSATLLNGPEDCGGVVICGGADGVVEDRGEAETVGGVGIVAGDEGDACVGVVAGTEEVDDPVSPEAPSTPGQAFPAAYAVLMLATVCKYTCCSARSFEDKLTLGAGLAEGCPVATILDGSLLAAAVKALRICATLPR